MDNTEKIKILYTAYSGLPSKNTGGPNRVIYDLINNIDEKRFKVGFVSKHSPLNNTKCANRKSFKNNMMQWRGNIGVKLHRKSNIYKKIVTHPLYLNHHFVSNNDYFKNLHIDDENFDIIHSHDVRSLYYLLNKSRGKKFLTVHSKGPIKNDLLNYVKPKFSCKKRLDEFEKFEDFVINEADKIIFPSFAAKALFNEFNQSLKFNDSKIRVIYNGIDYDYIQSIDPNFKLIKKYKAEQKTDLILLNVADHIQDKGVDKIIDVVNVLKTKLRINVLFINIGSGPEFKNLKRQVSESDLSKNIKFIGKISNEKVLSLMKAADIFIMLSRKVVFDYVVLEAMACGKVVIASNNGGNKEIISNQKDGYLVDDISSDEVAQIILNSDKQVGINAQATVKNFSINRMVKNYQDLYSQG